MINPYGPQYFSENRHLTCFHTTVGTSLRYRQILVMQIDLLSSHQTIMQQFLSNFYVVPVLDNLIYILDINLYLVPKSRKVEESDQEWRLSFSMVEKEVMLKVPNVYRKAYLICKQLRKMFPTGDEIQSFFLKTVLLMVLDEQNILSQYANEHGGFDDFQSEAHLFPFS